MGPIRNVLLLGVICSLLGSTAICSQAASSKSSEYIIKAWQVDQGLPENSATAMVQTPGGYLWFGTFNGLVRFDGVRFTVFDRSNSPLPSPGIVNLFLDKSGGLWISTLIGMAYVKDGNWRTFGPDSGWMGNFVKVFAESPSGILYMSTFDGHVERFLNGRFDQVPPLPSEPFNASSLYIDEHEHLCIITPSYAGCLTGDTWGEALPIGNLIQRDIPTGTGAPVIARGSRDGGVWIVTSRTLRKYRRGKLLVESRAPWPMQNLWNLLEDSSGNVWISSDRRGLYRHSSDGTWTHLSVEDGLTYDNVRFTFEDREKNIWVGTSGGGLMRLERRHFMVTGTESGLPQRVVKSLTIDRAGDLIVGMHSAGVLKVTHGHAVPLLPPHRVPVNARNGDCSFFSGLAFSTLVDGKGRIWVGTYSDGLFVVDGKNCRSFFDSRGQSSEIYSLFSDSHGNIWVGTDNAIYRFQDYNFQRYKLEDSPPLSAVSGFAESTSAGILWAANLAGGIYRLQGDRFVPAAGTQEMRQQQVSTLLADPDGTLWIGTADGGFACLRNGRITRIQEKQGLQARSIASILDDGNGYLWLGSNRGILRFSRTSLNELIAGQRNEVPFRIFDLSDGLPSLEFQMGTQPNAVKDSTGNLWFATWTGAVMVDPRKLPPDQNAAPLAIEDVLVDGRPIAGRQEVVTSTSFRPILIDVPPGARRVEIHYTGLSFVASQQIHFRYMLEGLDTEWVDVGERRVVYLQDVKPGHYRFHLKSGNDESRWNETGPLAELYIRPHFYQTFWFYGLCILGVFCSAIGVYWLNMRNLRKRQTELEIHVAERTQELQLEILERQRAEDALVRSEKDFRSVVENAPCGIFRLSLKYDRFLWVNPALVKMLGYASCEELLKVSLSMDLYLDPHDHLLPVDSHNGQDFAKEVEWRRKNGTSTRIRLVGRVLEGTENGATTLEVIAEDITERSLLEEQLRQSQKMEAVGRLAGGVAHDFNNLLGIIMGNTELLLMTMEEMSPFRKKVEHINQASMRGSALTQQLLAFGRKQVLQNEILDLNAVLGETGRMLLRIIGEDIELVLRPCPEPCFVACDRSRMEQVLLNLVINSRDAMPKGGTLTIEARHTELDQKCCSHNVNVVPGRYVALCVTDTGCGMSADTLSHLFEPFFTTKAPGKGTGLGLSTVYGIVKHSGGSIDVKTELGRGTTFEILLPAATPRDSQEENQTPMVQRALNSETVLLVEDQSELLQVMAETLAGLGYRVLSASGGQEAIEVAANFPGPINLLLTDVVMPGMSGRELAQRLAASRALRVLYISGYTHGVIAEHGVLESGTFLLQKPFKLAELGEKVREVLSSPVVSDPVQCGTQGRS